MAETSFAETALDEWQKWYECLDIAATHKKKKAYYEALVAAGLSFDHETPLCGYWRARSKEGGALDAVGVWKDAGGKLVVTRNGQPITDYRDVWPWGLLSPISYEWHEDYLAGKGWPDLDSGVAAFLGDDYVPEAWRNLPGAPPAAGHNQPSFDLSTLEGIKDAIAFLKPEVEKYAKITSDVMRDASQSLASQFADLRLKADKMRKKLVDPHVAEQRRINAEYNPVVHEADALEKQIVSAQTAWANDKKRAKEAEEAAERERQRQAEADALAANQPPPPPPRPQPQPAAVTEFRGAVGRMKKETPVEVIPDDGVTDWKALFEFYLENADVRAVLLKVARRDLKDNGVVPPGCRTETVMEVK